MNRIVTALDVLVRVIFALCISILITTSFYFYRELSDLKESKATSQIVTQKEAVTTAPPNQSVLTYDDSQLRAYIDSAVATVAGATKTVEPTTAVTSTTTKNPQASYITLGGNYTSSSTDWVSVPGSGVYVDLVEYGSSVNVSWEATLSVAHDNGTAYARIWDDTHKIAVNGSEVAVTNSSTPKVVGASGLALWSGNNLYEVQIKSLNSFDVTYSGGYLKIKY